MTRDETIIEIKKTLNKIKPFIQRDGGDLEFSRYENGIVYVKLSGACKGCGLINSTLSDGIEVILIEEVPGVIAVRLDED